MFIHKVRSPDGKHTEMKVYVYAWGEDKRHKTGGICIRYPYLDACMQRCWNKQFGVHYDAFVWMSEDQLAMLLYAYNPVELEAFLDAFKEYREKKGIPLDESIYYNPEYPSYEDFLKLYEEEHNVHSR